MLERGVNGSHYEDDVKRTFSFARKYIVDSPDPPAQNFCARHGAAIAQETSYGENLPEPQPITSHNKAQGKTRPAGPQAQTNSSTAPLYEKHRKTGGAGQVELPRGLQRKMDCCALSQSSCFVVKKTSSRRPKSDAVAPRLSMLRSKP